jgi:hypothetical protein
MYLAVLQFLPIEAEVAIETFEIEMAWNNLSIY